MHDFQKFTIDNIGNPIIFSKYEQKAVFDQDTLVVPDIGYFLAKLDKNTGNIIWKKNLASTSSSSVTVESATS